MLDKTSRLPLTSDYVFKRIFGQEENKEALKDFLESILKIKISNVEINNPEIPKNFYDSKYGMLDLKVTVDEKIIINVEMQLQNQYNLEPRSTYYMASTYAGQLGEGEPYTNCKRVIVIDILNFNYYKRDCYHSVARMIFENPEENEIVDMGYNNQDMYATKYLEMHVIELPKFKKKNPEIHTKLEQWLWLFIGGEEEVKKASKVNKEIERINKKLASMSLSREERNNYEFRLKAIRDEISAIDYATKKGLQQGREEGIRQGVEEGLEIGIKQGVERGIKQGIEQGIEQGIQRGVEKGKEEGKNIAKIELIKEMLKNDITIEQIEKITKLSKEKIEKIREDIESE